VDLRVEDEAVEVEEEGADGHGDPDYGVAGEQAQGGAQERATCVDRPRGAVSVVSGFASPCGSSSTALRGATLFGRPVASVSCHP
jgi:hypothetical protein